LDGLGQERNGIEDLAKEMLHPFRYFHAFSHENRHGITLLPFREVLHKRTRLGIALLASDAR
jgi:hypothetical protein